MISHPLIHNELARQRELQLRRSPGHTRPSKRRTTELTALVRAATLGDQQAWESLVTRFTPTLRDIVRGYRHNSADVEDVVQTVWASAFANLGRLVEAEAIGGWLCVIARREALRTLERRQREVLVDEPRYADEIGDSTPEGSLLDAEQRDAVRAAVERLPDHQRRLLRELLRHSDSSYADLSRRLDLPVGSIGPTRERAFARLRRDHRLIALVSAPGEETPR